MSGICGFVRLDGTLATPAEIAAMAAPLERRGPEGTGLWHAGGAALGFTLLATTPEALVERLPLTDPGSGCTIVADARLDNREELLAMLGPMAEARVIGDGELILRTYLAHGEACVEHLLGDFAFAIHDPRHERIFCGRDHIGMRQLVWACIPGRLFAFATGPRALLALGDFRPVIDEGRLADYFLPPMEGVDLTSTFFRGIERLPPAHTLTCAIRGGGVSLYRYWQQEPVEEMRLDSDEAYAAAFLEVFTTAVRARLRAPPGAVGAMLSGGMDSGSVVAVASGILAAEGKGPLPTFSGVSSLTSDQVETRAINDAMAIPDIDSHIIDIADLTEWAPRLQAWLQVSAEPFDTSMTMAHLVNARAREAGVKVVLDGGLGDTTLSAGTWIARLLRSGRFAAAWREIRLEDRFWGSGVPVWKSAARIALTAWLPDMARKLRRLALGSFFRAFPASDTILDGRFARRVGFAERRMRYLSASPPTLPAFALERARRATMNLIVCGRERYDRVGAALAVEPRDPFADLRVIRFCLGLPGDQLLRDGWPKFILRNAMQGKLPDSVRWRRGKEHNGWSFTRALLERHLPCWRSTIAQCAQLRSMVRSKLLDRAIAAPCEQLDRPDDFNLWALALWLDSLGPEGVDLAPDDDEADRPKGRSAMRPE